eukprot:8972366-Karenia_brevis.AAC.1
MVHDFRCQKFWRTLSDAFGGGFCLGPGAVEFGGTQWRLRGSSSLCSQLPLIFLFDKMVVKM